MTTWTHVHRLRKYRRKQAAAARAGRPLDRLLMLKWRYWRKIHGEHESLWLAA